MAQLVQRSPRLSGQMASRWSLARIGQGISWLKALSLPGVYRILRRLKVRYKRGRAYVHSPDPDYDLKLAYLQAAQQQATQAPQRVVLLYQDEFTYYRRASVARDYALQGSHDPRAHTGWGSNRLRRVAGCLDFATGRLLTRQRKRFNRRALIAFYREVEAAYPHAEVIFLAQDNWPVHFHPDILLALADSKIILLRLPTYAPWTNPIEQVWRLLYQDVLHQHPFVDDWLLLQDAVQLWLDQWRSGSYELLHAVGLYPY